MDRKPTGQGMSVSEMSKHSSIDQESIIKSKKCIRSPMSSQKEKIS